MRTETFVGGTVRVKLPLRDWSTPMPWTTKPLNRVYRPCASVIHRANLSHLIRFAEIWLQPHCGQSPIMRLIPAKRTIDLPPASSNTLAASATFRQYLP